MNTKATYRFSHELAPRIREWIRARGGVLVWKSSDGGREFVTPAVGPDGKRPDRPHWSVGSSPDTLITSEEQVRVFVTREVKRFRVGLKRGRGLQIVLTNASQARLTKALDAAGPNSCYRFDYETQEAVIYDSTHEVPLSEWP
jgi:hypothetical protein